MRVLIVEDYADVAAGLEFLVQDCGHEARAALTAEDALRIARDWRPELVLLDINLPGMNGYTLAWTLRNKLGLQTARIVAMSGDDPDPTRAQVARLDGHLMKPLDPRVIPDLLADYGAGASPLPSTQPAR